MSNWSTKKLGDICETNGGNIRTGPFGTQLHKSDYQEEGIPVVNPQDLVDGNVDTSSVARVGEDHVERLSQHKLKEGDIIYARRGDIGRRAYITEREAGWLCGTGCLKIDTGNHELDSKFLFYYLGDEKVTEWIYNQAVGATMANLNTSILSDVTVEYPSFDYQKQIASILSDFDDLIENNSRRIEILEEMARRIYREWFMHFRYPGHENDEMVDSGTDLGEIPEGWEVGSVGDLYQVKSGHPFRSKNLMDEGNFGVIKIGNITQEGEIDIDDVQYLEGDIVPDRAKKYLLEPGDILIAMTGAKVGKVGIMPKTPNNYYLNQRVGKYFSKVESVQSHMFLYSYLKTDFAQTIIKHLAQGAAQPNISATNLKSLELVIPTDDIFKKFEKKTQPLRDQMLLLRQKNRKLKETRDLLLPKLITGKIDVGNFNKDLAQ